MTAKVIELQEDKMVSSTNDNNMLMTYEVAVANDENAWLWGSVVLVCLGVGLIMLLRLMCLADSSERRLHVFFYFNCCLE